MILDLEKLIEKYSLKIRGVIHIGADTGGEIPVYKKIGIPDMLFFEPLPDSYKKLQEKVGAMAISCALGSKNGMMKMYVASNGQSSSLLEPALHKTQYPKITFDETIEVKVCTLDNVLTYRDCEKYNFINIDVQGYELEVFKGAVKTLEKIDCIISEVNRKELYKDCVQVGELDKFLAAFNFIRAETIWRGKTWGDAFYIKDNGIF
ncbi:MAG: FkbM family methyltransferase [Planctomycetota bacterium]|jgi:FkbM family methyltransferase